MCQVPHIVGARSIVRFAFAGLAAALLAGCADSSRFLGDPLSNPFKTASSAPSPSNYDMAPPPPYSPSRGAVRSQALAPPSDMPSRRVASYEAPSHESPRLSSDYRAPRTERTASIAAPSGHGSWTAEGGMAVIAANGDTANVLGQRYNVPTDALLRANGLASSADIQPGTRVVIPVYNANGGGGAAPSRLARSEPVRHEAAQQEPARHDHSSREKLLAKHESKQDEKLARREAERDAKLARYEKVERDAKEAKLAKIEKAEHEKAEREAKLARAEDAKQAARRQVEEREGAKQAAKRQVAEREQAMHGKMQWVKGAQPAKLAKGDKVEKGHGREKAMAKLDPRKAETDIAEKAPDSRAARKLAKAEAARETPVKMAKAEVAPQEMPRKAAAAPVDPEPTASLQPQAAEKAAVSGNGNPEFRWPAHGRIIQGFKSGGNDGINIAVPEGTSVKAAEAGTVAYAGSEIKGFGNLVLIRHPNGFVTAYANNGDIEVKRGEQVKRGQTIAKSGQSGNVASPQLHFELRKGSTPVDPTRYLAGL